ncbi:hypothetical protein ES703_79158 [subsurface metagenome]
MREKPAAILWIICVLLTNCCAWGREANAISTAPVELTGLQEKAASARLEPARMDGQAGIAVIFEGPNDLHYYATPESAAAPGFELIVKTTSEDFTFGKPVLPMWDIFVDPLGTKAKVYAGHFTVFVPIKEPKVPTRLTGRVDVTISGQACTDFVCLDRFEKIPPAKQAKKSSIPMQNARPIVKERLLLSFACSTIRIMMRGRTGQTQGIIFRDNPAKNARPRANQMG